MNSIWEVIKDYENVVWDWNGTLFNDSLAAAQAEEEVLKKYKVPLLSPEERKKKFRLPIQDYYEELGFDFKKTPYEEVSMEWLHFYEKFMKNCDLFLGARELLHKIKESGKNQYILTAAPEKHVRDLVENNFKINEYFHAVYGLPNNKAESKVYRIQELLNDFKFNPEKSIMIGDMNHDYEVAISIGADTLLIEDGHQEISEEVKRKEKVFFLQSRF